MLDYDNSDIYKPCLAHHWVTTVKTALCLCCFFFHYLRYNKEHEFLRDFSFTITHRVFSHSSNSVLFSNVYKTELNLFVHHILLFLYFLLFCIKYTTHEIYLLFILPRTHWHIYCLICFSNGSVKVDFRLLFRAPAEVTEEKIIEVFDQSPVFKSFLNTSTLLVYEVKNVSEEDFPTYTGIHIASSTLYTWLNKIWWNM